jgi:hypothetical protein
MNLKYTVTRELSAGSFGIIYEVLVEHEEMEKLSVQLNVF